DELLRCLSQRRAEVVRVRLASVDSIALNHSAVGNYSCLLSCKKIPLRDFEICRYRHRSRNNLLPLRFGTEQTARELLHLLNLPVDTAKWLCDIGIECALVVAKLAHL